MFPTSDPLDSHISAVRTLGVTPPLDWLDLVECFERYALMDARPTTARLINAVVDPASGDDLIALRADALAEVSATPTAHAEVTAAVKAAVLIQLREYYAPHAVANYASAADYFDGLAQKFTDAADLVDPESDPAMMVDEVEKARKAWTTAEQLAHRLTAALDGLSAAASLAGTPIDQEHLIALTVDTDGIHRRKVWSAWERTDGRTSRWGALIGIGAVLRTAALDGLQPYRRPRPMEVRQVRVGIGVRQEPFDPEDEELAAVASS
jgi:hypothetical protein